MEMFPSISRNQLQQIVAGVSSIESAIEILLCRKVRPPQDLPSLLKEQRAKLIIDDSTLLTMSRACVVNKAKVFYKTCLNQPCRLKKNLCVSFSGEPGIDAGAIKNDFFLKFFRYLQEELFEGNDYRLVPKYHWGSNYDFEIAGAAVAHSIILGGPGFAVLHPAIYAHMAIQDPEVMDVSDLPCADDIPLNSATSDTIDLIDKVSSTNRCA